MAGSHRRAPSEEEKSAARNRRKEFFEYLAAIAAVITAVVTGVSWIYHHVAAAGPDTPPPSASAASPTSTGTSPQAPSSGSAALTVGTCLDGNNAPVPCADEHRSEVAALGACASTTIAGYLGADATLDVVSPLVRARSVTLASQPACLVYLESSNTTTTMRNALASGHAAPFVRCRTTRGSTQDVSCTAPHDQELFAASPKESCTGLLVRYMGTSSTTVPDDLDVAPVTVGSTRYCAVSASGQNRLTDSLRTWGDSQLPTAPA